MLATVRSTLNAYTSAGTLNRAAAESVLGLGRDPDGLLTRENEFYLDCFATVNKSVRLLINSYDGYPCYGEEAMDDAVLRAVESVTGVWRRKGRVPVEDLQAARVATYHYVMKCCHLRISSIYRRDPDYFDRLKAAAAECGVDADRFERDVERIVKHIPEKKLHAITTSDLKRAVYLGVGPVTDRFKELNTAISDVGGAERDN